MIDVTWQVHQKTRSSGIQRKSDILRQEGRYSDSTVKYKEKATSSDRKVGTLTVHWQQTSGSSNNKPQRIEST